MELNNFMLIGGLILLSFAIFSYYSLKANFSSLIIFIISGVALSQFFSESVLLHQIAELGIVLLFFLLGLEFPLGKMVSIARRSWQAGVLDIILNIGITILISFIFGLNLITSFFIGAIVYASSSSITIKLLEEKKRLVNKEAEFILAILIFEDLIAPILVSITANILQDNQFSIFLSISLLVKIILFISGAIIIGYYGFRKMGKFIEKYFEKDFMVMLIIGTALTYSGLAIYLGLSEVLGAFLAGIMLAETGKSDILEGLVISIRNVTLPFFFFYFGTSIYLGAGIRWPVLLIFVVIWSVIAKILVSYWGGQFFGLNKKSAIRGGFSLIQRGEFSVIIAALAPSYMRTYAGIYILLIAIIGIIIFNRAHILANFFIKE